MRKLILLFLALVLLCGCQKAIDFNSDLETAIQTALKETLLEQDQNNCSKTYYSYYKKATVGKGESGELYNSFTINGNKCLLTLDVVSIVENTIYSDVDKNAVRDSDNLRKVIYAKTGIMECSNNEATPFKINVCQQDDNCYFIYVQTKDFIFIADVSSGSCADTLYEMLVILRSCIVNRSQVAIDYSSDNIVVYQTNIISLFEETLPESGYVIDIIDDWKEDTSFIIIDNTHDADIDGGSEEDMDDGDSSEDFWGEDEVVEEQ